MHFSARRAKAGEAPPPDWLPFLMHASSRPEGERREWLRDVISRDAELKGLGESVLRCGWYAPGPADTDDMESLLNVLGSDLWLRLTARLSASRWMSREATDEPASQGKGIPARVMIAAILAAGVADEAWGRVRVEIEMAALMSAATSGTEPEGTDFAAILSAWGLNSRDIPEWEWVSRLSGLAAEFLGDYPEDTDRMEARLREVLSVSGISGTDCRQVVAAMPARLRAAWLECAPPGGWPPLVSAAARQLARTFASRPENGLSAPAWRRLQRQLDLPAGPLECAGRILDFSRAYMPGLAMGVGWRGENDEPDSSWWRVDSSTRNSLPRFLSMTNPGDPLPTIANGDLRDEGFPARGFARVLPISGPGGSRGWLVASRRDGAGFSPLEATALESLCARMSGAVAVHSCNDRFRAESSKNKLLKRELLYADERLTALEQLNRYLEKAVICQEVLPGVFHKLKNKITPVLGYTQMLKARSQDEYLHERLGKIEKSAESLTQLLNRLRKHFSSPPPLMRTDNLNRVIRDVRPHLEKAAHGHEAEIEWRLDPAVDDFVMSPGQVEMLVRELVLNGLRAIEQGDGPDRKVVVKTRKTEPGVCELRVWDSGTGIREEDLEKIWAPFFALFPDGAGLGLAMCEQVMHRHGVSRRVESRPGEFSEFTCVFPGMQAQEESTAPEKKIVRPRGRVLILDDESYMVDLMREILQEVGDLEIHATTSGTRAMRWLREQEYELVIADLYLPDVSGLDIFRTLNERGMGDRLILVTADPGTPDVREFLTSRNIVFLQKPLELMLFKQKVLEKLSQKEA